MKICSDCIYFDNSDFPKYDNKKEYPACSHPRIAVNPTNGSEVRTFIDSARKGFCGVDEAKYFLPKAAHDKAIEEGIKNPTHVLNNTVGMGGLRIPSFGTVFHKCVSNHGYYSGLVLTTKKEGAMNEWYRQHKGTLITIAICVVVDHFLFAGAFKSRLQGMVDSFLKKTEKKIGEAGDA